MRGDSIYTGVEDDPLDDVPDTVGAPRLMIDLEHFFDVVEWED